ncbi:uncharacterized protein LOC120893490 [Anopheles arabiensis]|uniref:uncharacterized protein LOC120893490 n=1 Tax=Anopheles arabiensis TaxID=7173 RepID=UPI001AAD409A|nr:uncharacterized protein LOC120893490 [Anopheles arabiensis]
MEVSENLPSSMSDSEEEGGMGYSSGAAGAARDSSNRSSLDRTIAYSANNFATTENGTDSSVETTTGSTTETTAWLAAVVAETASSGPKALRFRLFSRLRLLIKVVAAGAGGKTVNGGVIKTAHNFAMAAICFACAVPLDAADCIVGCAYCEATFHRGCCRLPSELIDAVLTHIDLHWSCTGCTNILKNPRCRSVKEIGAQVGFQAALTSTVAAVGKLIEPIIAEVRSGFTLLQNAPIPQLCNTDPRPVAGRKRRRIIEDSMSPDVNKNVNIRQNNMYASSSPSAYTNTTVGIPPPSTLPEELMGTDSLSSPLRAAFPQPATDRIWIRLSRLSTAVTVEQVVASVKRRLATDDVLAYCLLRKGVSVDSVNWLSFKMRVPAALRDAALAPSSWPVGIGVREFVQSRQREHGHSSSPITIKHRSLTRTPVVIDRRSMPRTPTSTVYHSPANASTSQAQTLTSPQLGEHTLNDTTHGPNSTLIDGPLLIRRTSNTNLQQTTLDRFFHE